MKNEINNSLERIQKGNFKNIDLIEIKKFENN
jgi:hypothetical protein